MFFWERLQTNATNMCSAAEKRLYWRSIFWCIIALWPFSTSPQKLVPQIIKNKTTWSSHSSWCSTTGSKKMVAFSISFPLGEAVVSKKGECAWYGEKTWLLSFQGLSIRAQQIFRKSWTSAPKIKSPNRLSYLSMGIHLWAQKGLGLSSLLVRVAQVP